MDDPDILIVEDHHINQRLLTAMLDRMGLSHLIANNGLEAVEFVSTRHCACILMDIQMPVMDGLEATRRIRALGRDLPIIAVTAHCQSYDRRLCLEAGMDEMLCKPLRYEQLLKELESRLPVAGGGGSHG